MNYQHLIKGLQNEVKNSVRLQTMSTPYRVLALIALIPVFLVKWYLMISYYVYLFLYNALLSPVTYLEAWQAIPPHRPEDYLYAFLACITRRNALNCCREREALKRSGHIIELSTELEQCIPGTNDTARCVDAMALRQALNGFLATLSREKRCIFLRRYWYMDSVAEISQRFAVSESKVKTTLLRCRRQLRTYLEKEGFTV